MKRVVSWLGLLVLIGTLLVSIPRYASAFSQAEPTLFDFVTAPVTGFGFGLLLELGIFYCIDSWFDAQRRGLKWHWLLLVGVGVQLILGPVIVAPAIVGHLVNQTDGELAGVLSWRPAMWAWASVVAAAPALLLAAVAAASYLRVPVSARKAEATVPEPGKKEPEKAREVPVRERVLLELDRNPAMTAEQIVEQFQISDRYARKLVKEHRNGSEAVPVQEL